MKFIQFFLLVISISFTTSCKQTKNETSKVPNVIFVLVDDLGYSEINSYGNTFNETPNIDELAHNGLRFTNAYASAPVCSPFRASLITGQHPARIGITDYLRPHEDRHLSEEYTTIADIFKQSGYHTGMIGKWHLSGYEKNGAVESGPEKHGFVEVILTERRGISGGSYFYPYHFNLEVEQKIFPVEHLTDRINLETVEFIKRNNPEKTGKPFFLYKSHYSVHTNLNGKDDYVKNFSTKAGAGLSPLSDKNNVHLAAMLKSVDDGIGLIKKELEATNQLDNTIIILMSDNGGETNVTSNSPLRAGKSTIYEGGLRVPLIVWWPGMIDESATVDQPVSNMDFLSTFGELLDFDMSTVQVQDGVSMMDIWKMPNTKRNIHESLYWHYPLEAPHFLGGFSGGAIRKGNFKLLEDFTTKESYLYDLSEDMQESKDLSLDMPELKSELLNELSIWRDSLRAAATGYIRTRNPQPDYPEPYGSNIELNIDEKIVPWINYGVEMDDEGFLYFGGKRNFLNLLHLYIPDVTAKKTELSATVRSETDNGVIIAHGEEVFGTSVYLKDGHLYFSTRKYGELTSLKTNVKVNSNFRFKAILEKNGDMKLFVDGQLVDEANIGESLPIPPDDPISLGTDFRRIIGEYEAENYFQGYVGNLEFKVD